MTKRDYLERKRQEQERVREEREQRRRHAAEAWPPADPATRLRTALEIAAFLLVVENLHDLADWLLCARPEHARAVAAGVAALALRNGVSAPWDALAAVDALDLRVASDLFETEGDLVWGPEPGALCDEQ